MSTSPVARGQQSCVQRAYLRYISVVPVVLVIAVHRSEYPRTLRLGVIDVVVPSLEDKHREVGLLGKTRGERQAGCTAANDSVKSSVQLHVTQGISHFIRLT